MSTWLQKSASIQRRMSPLKFDHFRYPKPDFTASNLSPILQPNDQTLEGSFSSVSKPIFATKYSFFSIFQDLQDSHTFAPLRIQNTRKNSSNFFEFLLEFLQKIIIFRQFSSNFGQILMIFSRDFAEHSRKC